MTKTQIGIVGVIIVGLAIPLAMQNQTQTKLREENASLRKQVERLGQLTAENERLSNQLARVTSSTPAQPAEQTRELAKLRGEVGRLQTASAQPRPSPLSGIATDPEMMKMIRTQNKAALAMVYKDFAKEAKLTTEQSEKLNDLMADNVVDSISHITDVLRDGKTREEINALFDARDIALGEKVQAMLGPEGFSQYQDYTRSLGSHLVAEQLKDQLSGDKATKEEHSKQIYQIMQEEKQAALAAAGLGPDFQTVPMLNLRNIASEEEAERNLKLIEGVYERVAARADFLGAEDLKKFNEFRTNAINMSRMALTMNRKMMAPATK